MPRLWDRAELEETAVEAVEAVATGLARTGRIVTTAAALLAITFFAAGTPRQQVGRGIRLAR
jgi:RND superfamily putative drug exporter